MIVKAAAKINLMLDVVGKLPNGYQLIYDNAVGKLL